MRRFLITYKYINTMFRERFRTMAWTYDPEVHKMDIHEELLKSIYDDIRVHGKNIDLTGGESVAISDMWEVD